MQMTGNTILVTGATSGIGRALAEAFHDRGNQVIVVGRRQRLINEVTRARPGMAGLVLDVADPGSVGGLAANMRDRFPTLNVLVANAGISRTEDMMSDAWDVSAAEAVVETNILGVLRTTTALLPILKRQTNPVIVATSSALAFVPRADFPAYCASKSFLHSWLQSLRHQLRHVPVEVLELSPPYVQTELTGDAQRSDPRAMPLDAFTSEIMAMLEHGDHPGGEIVLPRDLPRRRAERDGRYDEVFAMLNPG